MKQIYDVLRGLNYWSVAFRILLATFIGGCIGLDRGRHGRAAGLRTHILVCLGSAMTTMIGLYVSRELGSTGDPLRMGSQVVSGIGFLGAGTIMVRNHSHVTGLTTAAGLWATACIGLAIGVGFYFAVLIAAFVVLVTITILTRLEKSSKYRDKGSYYIELKDILHAKVLYEEVSSLLSEVDVVPAHSGIADHVGLELVVSTPECNKKFKKILRDHDDIVIALPLH